MINLEELEVLAKANRDYHTTIVRDDIINYDNAKKFHLATTPQAILELIAYIRELEGKLGNLSFNYYDASLDPYQGDIPPPPRWRCIFDKFVGGKQYCADFLILKESSVEAALICLKKCMDSLNNLNSKEGE